LLFEHVRNTSISEHAHKPVVYDTQILIRDKNLHNTMTIITLKDRLSPDNTNEKNKEVLNKLFNPENKLFLYLLDVNQFSLMKSKKMLKKSLRPTQMDFINPFLYEIQIWETLYDEGHLYEESSIKNPFQRLYNNHEIAETPKKLLDAILFSIIGVREKPEFIPFSRIIKLRDIVSFYGQDVIEQNLSEYYDWRDDVTSRKLYFSKDDFLNYCKDVINVLNILENIAIKDYPYLLKDLSKLEQDKHYKVKVE